MKNNRPQKSLPGSLYTKLLGITLAVLIINLLSAYTINPDPGPAPDPSRFKKVVITEPGKLDE
ncbi:MAG: hypothetical protein RL640_912, partial [Bacteroidota bacterium]